MQQINYSKDKYDKMVKAASPPSKTITNCIRAFLTGGMVCALAQFITNLFVDRGMAIDDARLLTAVSLIVAAILFTGLGIYDKFAERAGAGSFVPITGFANSIAAPAIEFKKEGFLLGVGAKMFVIAGPVIVYGTMTSVLVGLVYYFTR